MARSHGVVGCCAHDQLYESLKGLLELKNRTLGVQTSPLGGAMAAAMPTMPGGAVAGGGAALTSPASIAVSTEQVYAEEQFAPQFPLGAEPEPGSEYAYMDREQ